MIIESTKKFSSHLKPSRMLSLFDDCINFLYMFYINIYVLVYMSLLFLSVFFFYKCKPLIAEMKSKSFKTFVIYNHLLFRISGVGPSWGRIFF